jgi:hypothetical protein
MTPPTTELQIVQVPIDELHPDPADPRKISDAELDVLTRSLRGSEPGSGARSLIIRPSDTAPRLPRLPRSGAAARLPRLTFEFT